MNKLVWFNYCHGAIFGVLIALFFVSTPARADEGNVCAARPAEAAKTQTVVKPDYPVLYNSTKDHQSVALDWAAKLAPKLSKTVEGNNGGWACENVREDGSAKIMAFGRGMHDTFEIKFARKKEDGPVIQSSWTFQDPLYDPKVITTQFWTTSGSKRISDGTPVYLVTAQAGALAQQVFAVTVDHDVINVSPPVLCGYFEVAQLDKEGHPQIITHTGDLADIPGIFDWNGREFVDSNRKYPRFFDKLVRNHAYHDDESESELLEYANRNQEAIAKIKAMLKTCPSDQRQELTIRLKKLQESTNSRKPPRNQG
jgi:hypothetical protein